MQQIISEKQDLTWLTWSKVRNSSGTAGSFMKAYSELNGVKTYYKLSNYNTADGIIGYECVNEIIVDRLLTILEIEHLHYQLIHADINIDDRTVETWLCASQDFKKKGESKTTLEAYYQQEKHPGEGVLDFCVRNGWERDVYQMLVIDYLILNRDRHGANIEVLRNRNTHGVRLAPLFDHGLSLMCRAEKLDAVMKFDLLSDMRVQCFVGGSSTWENLKLIPEGCQPIAHPLLETDKDRILEGLEDILPKAWLNRLWEMIWARWLHYESICHQG